MPMFITLVLLLALATVSCDAPTRTKASQQAAVVVDVAWQPPANTANIQKYVAYRRPGVKAAEQYACEAPKDMHTCTDPSPLAGESYYTVYSRGGGQWSEPSNMVKVVIENVAPPAGPGVPQQLKVQVTIQGPIPAPQGKQP